MTKTSGKTTGKSKSLTVFLFTGVAGVLITLCFFWLNRGYGEVSPLTYQYSKALYSACLNRSTSHLDQVEQLLSKADAESLPTKERQWIDDIIVEARDGDWQSAAKKARRMMEDQVRY